MSTAVFTRPTGGKAATALDQAVLKTLAYGDLFDHPLTAREIHRYLLGHKASLEEVERTLQGRGMLGDKIENKEGFHLLRGRAALVEKRKARAAVSHALWPKALAYARALSRLPGVRMIAVTGSLAMDNAEHGGDVDFLVVTKSAGLWRARLCVIAYAKLVQVLRRERVCVNYLITESNLAFVRRNDYTAREVAQMIPLYGYAVYRELLRQNGWVLRHLPNFTPRVEGERGSVERGPVFQKAGEWIMGLFPEAWLHRWQVARIARQRGPAVFHQEEVILRPDCFKGHVDGHGARIERNFKEKLGALGLS